MKSLTPKGGNDKVYTPELLAEAIVGHFNPSGKCLDPCMGDGAFSTAMGRMDTKVFGFEIDYGHDFLKDFCEEDFAWIITNPPWSQLRAFLKKSMEVADNVVFLCCTNALFYRGRQRDIEEAGFGIKEIAMIEPVPVKPWPQSGFSLSANHLQKGWTGDTKMSRINWSNDDWL